MEFSSLEDAAQHYADIGWRVHPLHYPMYKPNDQNVFCSCRVKDCARIGKHPMVRNWRSAATTDEDQIGEWWDEYPSANIGLATGAASKIIVLDVDVDKGGSATLKRFRTANTYAETGAFVAATGHGWHEYYQHPGGTIPNFVEFGGKAKGLDLRADGGNVVLPPSFHYTGKTYKWIIEPNWNYPKPAPTPAWLLRLIKSATVAAQPKATTQPVVVASAYSAAALRYEVSKIGNATHGGRNNQLNMSAYKLGGLVGAGLLDRSEVERELELIAIAVGLKLDETRRTIKSGLDAGILKPLMRVKSNVR